MKFNKLRNQNFYKKLKIGFLMRNIWSAYKKTEHHKSYKCKKSQINKDE